jgi:hypothetical protein
MLAVLFFAMQHFILCDEHNGRDTLNIGGITCLYFKMTWRIFAKCRYINSKQQNYAISPCGEPHLELSGRGGWVTHQQYS